jgi:hypothetical protein
MGGGAEYFKDRSNELEVKDKDKDFRDLCSGIGVTNLELTR